MTALSVLFNFIPGSGLVAPANMFELNAGGEFTTASRIVLIGHKTAAGQAAIGVELPIGSQTDADAAFGPGSMLREMYRIARRAAPVQSIWAIAVAEAGAVQTWTLTVGSGAAGTSGVGTLDIHGERIQVPVSSTDTPTSIAANIAALVNSYFNPLTSAMLQYTATSAAGVVTLTARHAGALFAEDPHYFPVAYPDGVASNLFTTASVTVASGTAGTGVPTLTTPLANLGDTNCDTTISPWGDQASLSTYATWLSDLGGRWSYARQSYGHMWTASSQVLSGLTTLGLAQNDRHTTVIPRVPGGVSGSPHPAWLWAAGIASLVTPWLTDTATGNVSRNQSGLIVPGLAPPRDATQLYNYPTRNTLLQSGVSTWTVDAANNVTVDKLITLYQTGASGQPDATFRDIQAMYQSMIVLRYLLYVLQTQFGNRAVAKSNPGGLASIVTPADVKGALINANKDLIRRGVLADDQNFTKDLVVVINAANPRRIDIGYPANRVMPLDIFAGNATLFSGTLPAAA